MAKFITNLKNYKESVLNGLQKKANELRPSVNSPTDNHLVNTVSREVTARIGDVARLTKFFASSGGVKFAAKQGAIFQVTNQDEKGKERLLSSGASVAKLIGGLLKQAAVSGTGNRFVNPIFHNTQYLNPESKDGSAIFSYYGIPGPLDFQKDNRKDTIEQGKFLFAKHFADKIDEREDSLAGKLKERTDREYVNRRVTSKYYNNTDSRISSPLFVRNIIDKVEGTVEEPNDGSNLKKYRTSSLNSEKLIKIKRDEGPRGITTKLAPKRGNRKNTRGPVDFNPDTEEDKLITSEVLETPEYRDQDIIPFEFQVLNPSNPSIPKFVYFRAYLDSFNDSYNGEWNSTKYIGRAEPMYNYNGFSRAIDFSFKIAATTRQELLPLYKKLNYLVGTTAPSYDTDQTFMRGIIVRVTIGDYLMQVPGFFTNIGLSWDKAYSWETGTFKLSNSPLEDFNQYIVEDNIPKVPHILDVSVTFTPIHTFNPEIDAPFITNTDILRRKFVAPPLPPVRPRVPINPPPPSQLIEDDLDAIAFDLGNSPSNVTPSFPPTPVSREEQELEQAFLNAGINI